MDLDTIERLIDEALEKEDYERAAMLLKERENLLKSLNISPELAKEIMERDERRIEMVKSKKADLLKAIYSSRRFGQALSSYERSLGEESKKSWGRG